MLKNVALLDEMQYARKSLREGYATSLSTVLTKIAVERIKAVLENVLESPDCLFNEPSATVMPKQHCRACRCSSMPEEAGNVQLVVTQKI